MAEGMPCDMFSVPMTAYTVQGRELQRYGPLDISPKLLVRPGRVIPKKKRYKGQSASLQKHANLWKVHVSLMFGFPRIAASQQDVVNSKSRCWRPSRVAVPAAWQGERLKGEPRELKDGRSSRQNLSCPKIAPVSTSVSNLGASPTLWKVLLHLHWNNMVSG